jgi:hypothetical protein
MSNESYLYFQYGKEEENEPPQLDWSKQPNIRIQPQRICSIREIYQSNFKVKG